MNETSEVSTTTKAPEHRDRIVRRPRSKIATGLAKYKSGTKQMNPLFVYSSTCLGFKTGTQVVKSGNDHSNRSWQDFLLPLPPFRRFISPPARRIIHRGISPSPVHFRVSLNLYPNLHRHSSLRCVSSLRFPSQSLVARVN